MDHLDDELMSGMEIERKFLVHKQKNWKELAVSSSHIQQGYMAAVNTVRIRIRDEKAFLTIKGKSVNGGLSRYEFEKEISIDEAQQLLLLLSRFPDAVQDAADKYEPSGHPRHHRAGQGLQQVLL